MRILSFAAAIVIAFGLMSGAASAHTISIGNFNAGAPGAVEIVLGTYNHGAGLFQGSMQLIAGPGIPPLIPLAPGPFTSVLLAKPAGLIDGTNNFYADSHGSGQWGTKPSDSYTTATNLVGLGPVVNWLSATFTGLSAGVYTYEITGMTAVNWNNVNSFDPNWTGTIIIPESSTQTPEPHSLMLLGLGVLAVVRKRRKKTA